MTEKIKTISDTYNQLTLLNLLIWGVVGIIIFKIINREARRVKGFLIDMLLSD